jgi:hypothetical protein
MFAGSYINVKAPDSAGWLLSESSYTGITFGKPGPSKGETFAAYVKGINLPPAASPSEFEEVIRAGFRNDTSPERFDVQREASRNTDERGYPCVRHEFLARDKKPYGSDAPLLLAMDSLYCRHPKRQETGFVAVFSFRGKAEYSQLRSEAESFFQGVQVPD